MGEAEEYLVKVWAVNFYENNTPAKKPSREKVEQSYLIDKFSS